MKRRCWSSVLDIAADRAVEITLWVVFASLEPDLIVIPIIFIIPGADRLGAQVSYTGSRTAPRR